MEVLSISGYNPETYNAYFGKVNPIVLIGAGLEARVKFDRVTNRPVDTGEIDSKRINVYYPGMGIQAVKLPADYNLPDGIKDLSEVELVSPEACVVGRNIYVRAKGLKAK